ncbi:hypothetical protein LJB84_03360, partial [Bacteroidales bacterium OttesenSCG-928-J19]|nr:hypothetical protein [Bacteroidales bacterium OttesenSCG-928-J19]
MRDIQPKKHRNLPIIAAVIPLLLLLTIITLSACERAKKNNRKVETEKEQIDSLALIQLQEKAELAKRDSLNKAHQEKEMQREMDEYDALPFISPEEITKIRPVIAKWIDFYEIDISQFRFLKQETTDIFNQFPDTLSLYYREFTDEDASTTRLEVDYSPNKRFYVDLGLNWEVDDEGRY